MLRPGRPRERGRRRGDAGAVRARLRARRGDQRDLRRPLQPASAHVLRPAAAAGRPGVLRHHPLVHGLPDLLLPHVQRRLRDAGAAGRLQAVPRVARRRDRRRCGPASTTDKIAEVWPTAEEIGMQDERAAFGLQFGHGLGVGLYEAPMISRLHSFDDPVELEVGMVFALETYCAASDGRSAARIEEEVDRHADRAAGDHALPGRRAARRRAATTSAAPTSPTAAVSPRRRWRGGADGRAHR